MNCRTLVKFLRRSPSISPCTESPAPLAAPASLSLYRWAVTRSSPPTAAPPSESPIPPPSHSPLATLSREALTRRSFFASSAACLTWLSTHSAVASIIPASYNVHSFGATGNGTTLDTAAIQRAITAAAAADGGIVHFPAGHYLCFTLHLRSRITLRPSPIAPGSLRTGDIPEQIASYPEPKMFGNTPAHGFYIRHAQQIELRHILVEPGTPEPRPLVWMDDVRHCHFDDVRSTDPTSSIIDGIHTEAIEIAQPFPTPPQKN